MRTALPEHIKPLSPEARRGGLTPKQYGALRSLAKRRGMQRRAGGRVSNREYAKHNAPFIEACKRAEAARVKYPPGAAPVRADGKPQRPACKGYAVEATARQASKFRRGLGEAVKFKLTEREAA